MSRWRSGSGGSVIHVLLSFHHSLGRRLDNFNQQLFALSSARPLAFPSLNSIDRAPRFVHGDLPSADVGRVHGEQEDDDGRAEQVLDEKGQMVRWRDKGVERGCKLDTMTCR
jgi:hypothetical protein